MQKSARNLKIHSGNFIFTGEELNRIAYILSIKADINEQELGEIFGKGTYTNSKGVLITWPIGNVKRLVKGIIGAYLEGQAESLEIHKEIKRKPKA